MKKNEQWKIKSYQLLTYTCKMIKKYYIEKVALWRKMIFLRFSTVVEQKPSEKKNWGLRFTNPIFYPRSYDDIFNQIDRHLHVHRNLETFCHKHVYQRWFRDRPRAEMNQTQSRVLLKMLIGKQLGLYIYTYMNVVMKLYTHNIPNTIKKNCEKEKTELSSFLSVVLLVYLGSIL